jgi:DNA-binding Lrp family transcriptional regulator
MDAVDRRILNLIQQDLPITPEPFGVVGEKLGIDEAEVRRRVQRLKELGIIRRIGAVFDLRKLGFVSTLCAARVPESRMQAFVAAVNATPGVTHNYRRDHDYNIWFTLIAADEGELAGTLERVRRETGVDDILSLRAVKTYKINARFEV